MKVCQKCYEEKSFDDFGQDVHKPDGLNYYCKSCIKKRNDYIRKKDHTKTLSYYSQYRENNREKIREYSKLSYYLNIEKRRAQSKKSYEKHKAEIAKKRAAKSREIESKKSNAIRQKEWRRKNPSRAAQIVAGWKKRNPQKAAAHSLVLYAIRSGVLTKKDRCEICNMIGKIEGHHEDYNNPLSVKWICKSCHSEKHRVYR